MKIKKYILLASVIFTLVVLIPSCAVNPVTGKRQLMFMTEEQEIALGAQYHPSVVSTFGVYENEAVQQFLNEKGTAMGKISHRPNIDYKFTILDSPVVNAFAVPGGYLYFTRGILAQFNSEAELIGVLGHEMGHVTARHTAQQQTNQQLGQVILIGGMLVSKEIYEYADVAMAGMQLLFLSFSRENERQADKLGVEYATKIGYDSHKMADFFGVLDKMSMESSEGGVPTFLSTHPSPDDRYSAVHSMSDEWQGKYPGESFAVNSNDYLRMIDGLVYGEDPRQGFVENNTFYHPELRFKFSFPANWTLANQPTQVQIISTNQDAGIIFSLSSESTPEAASQKSLTDLKLSMVNSRELNINGAPAMEVLSQQVNQSADGTQQTTKVLSCFIKKADKVYEFHGIADATTFDSYRPAFESTMKAFSDLNDPAKLNVKPDRIKIISIRSASVSLADAFEYYKVPKDKYEELALLNNKELDHQLKTGDLIKIITQ